MKVIVTIRQEETRHLEAEGNDYASVRAAAEAMVPEGWEIIAYRAYG
ncbi:hypothetical protein [Mycetocola manganoxydans]|nr:hypothetical protein [Mycetocola manganoxydans]GHD50838.1 hypothetical protein GCM10008097_25260 [Mycetocola manganoxydans]